jgi:hypothetical protein
MNFYDFLEEELEKSDFEEMYNELKTKGTYAHNLLIDRLFIVVYLLEHYAIKREAINIFNMYINMLQDEDASKLLNYYSLLYIIYQLQQCKLAISLKEMTDSMMYC